MGASIDYRCPLPYPAATVYAALVDPEYLRARLAEIGGPGAELVSHRADDVGAAYTLRQELDAAGMPPMVRSMLSGNLVVERAETWTVARDGTSGETFQGTVTVGVVKSPVPASADGELGLPDMGSGAEFRLSAEVRVGVPLFAGRIEEYVAGQIRTLLDLESQFTQRWLKQHAG